MTGPDDVPGPRAADDVAGARGAAANMPGARGAADDVPGARAAADARGGGPASAGHDGARGPAGPVVVSWPDGPGVVTLPDGLRVRGRGLRRPPPNGPPPQLALAFTGRPPARQPWPVRWVRWPDFRLPADAAELDDALRQAHELAAAGARVELSCGGGRGRTGTALACLAIRAGVAPDEAVAWVRAHYAPRAVETPGQRRFVAAFSQ